jgi:hypothetical protein
LHCKSGIEDVNSAPDHLQLLDARSQANEDGDGTVEAVTKVVKEKQWRRLPFLKGRRVKMQLILMYWLKKWKGGGLISKVNVEEKKNVYYWYLFWFEI